MSAKLMFVSPNSTTMFQPPPWNLLNSKGATQDANVVNAGDIVFMIEDDNRSANYFGVYIIHAATAKTGYIERGLLQPVEAADEK